MDSITLRPGFQKGLPIYQQLYAFVIEEIRCGNLKGGERLPSKKQLCAHLKISQSTVETAYDMLVAEGYLRAKPRSGYYVSPLERLEHAPSKPDSPENADSGAANSGAAPVTPRYKYDFSTSAVDIGVFPYSSWAKLTRETAYQNPGLLLRGERQGDLCLRQAIAKFLHEYRGVRCSPEQIIVGAGIEYLLDLLLQVLDPDDIFALENPGYETTYKTVSYNGRKIELIGLDDAGMRIDALIASGANIAYITPSHQFPLGITMPVGRRIQLLKWAVDSPSRYLIEDDYDSEFRHSTRPIPAMQGLDQSGKVIYVGTFSRSIAPSIRVAYLVLPPVLLARYRTKFTFSSSTVSRFEQYTLFRFIESGMFIRHLNRVGTLYKKRKDCLTEALSRPPFTGRVRISGEHAGLHFLLRVKNGMNEPELVDSARDAGIRLHGLSEYERGDSIKRLETPTLVLGYAGLSEEQLKDAVSILGRAWFGV